jgi:ferric-dicitrate binding protein FerR (iron transport regulator)
MTTNHSSHYRPPTDDPGLAKIWDLAEAADLQSDPGLAVTRQETEQALRSVHELIGSDSLSDRQNGSEGGESNPNRFWIWSRYLVAAVALIVAGSWYFFVPVTITVPYGQQMTLELPDGSIAEMNSGTTISFSRFAFNRNNRDLSMNGEAWFDVTPSDIPFTVKANGTLTRVLGTSFNVRSWNSDPDIETELTVTSGSVEFMPQNTSSGKVILKPGELSRWNSNLQTPTEPVLVETDEIAGWRENKLIFREQSLSAIIDELERRFDTQITLDVQGASDETLTAYYNQPQKLQDVLIDISMVKGLRYSETANGYRIFK